MLPKSLSDKYRLNMPDNVYTEMVYDSKKRLGRLINLSTQGACFEFIDKGELPSFASETTLKILLPEQDDTLSLKATVVWTRQITKGSYSQFVNVGVKFNFLDTNTYDCVWDFIVESVSPPSWHPQWN